MHFVTKDTKKKKIIWISLPHNISCHYEHSIDFFEINRTSTVH